MNNQDRKRPQNFYVVLSTDSEINEPIYCYGEENDTH